VLKVRGHDGSLGTSHEAKWHGNTSSNHFTVSLFMAMLFHSLRNVILLLTDRDQKLSSFPTRGLAECWQFLWFFDASVPV